MGKVLMSYLALVDRTKGFAYHAGEWTTIGAGPRSLVRTECTVTEYLGLSKDDPLGLRGGM